MASLTSANAVLMFTIDNLFNAPFQLQQFAADDITDIESVAKGEFLMGVDGHLTGGFVFNMVPQRISLMADSPSVAFFDSWVAGQQQITDLYWANATLTLPSINKQFTLTRGGLRNYPPAPQVRKILSQALVYEIVWQSVTNSPYGATAQ